MNIFDELHHRLGSKTRIRSLFKDASVSELEKIIARIKDVQKEKLKSKKEADELRQLKMNSIQEIKKELEARGLTLSDLDEPEEAGSDSKRRRNVSKHTFEYQTVSGDTVKWHGSTTGRLPKDFQDYLDRTGKKRAECIADS